jgi:hypothetical protein
MEVDSIHERNFLTLAIGKGLFRLLHLHKSSHELFSAGFMSGRNRQEKRLDV